MLSIRKCVFVLSSEAVGESEDTRFFHSSSPRRPSWPQRICVGIRLFRFNSFNDFTHIQAPLAVTLSAVLQKKRTRGDRSTVPARTSRLYALLCSGSCAPLRSTSALLGPP